MYARIVRQLWVKTTSKHVPLSHRDDFLMALSLLPVRRVRAQRRHDFHLGIQFQPRQFVTWGLTGGNDCIFEAFLAILLALLFVGQNLFYDGGADEDASIWFLLLFILISRRKEGQVQTFDETLLLSPEVISSDAHVQSAH